MIGTVKARYVTADKVRKVHPLAEETDSEQRKAQLSAHEGDVVTLHYQHTFNRTGGTGDVAGIQTATTEQRPDIVLNIRKASGEVVLTYLYDAKYRVINDRRLDSDFEEQDRAENAEMPGGDYPPTDAVNQMHRYRDAIYYSKEHEPFRSKEIIGGYVLFPGRGTDAYIRNRYYSTSIQSVNIGAFPLLPGRSGLLKDHLEKILLQYTSSAAHVRKARPQRTLAYVTEQEKAAMPPKDMVMIAMVGTPEQRQWAFERQWYNIPLEQIADSPWNQAQYLLLTVPGEKAAGNLCRIVRSRHEVWTKEKLLQHGYPTVPHHDAYFMIRLWKPEKTEEPLRQLVFDVQNIPDTPWWDRRNSPILFVGLSALKTVPSGA